MIILQQVFYVISVPVGFLVEGDDSDNDRAIYTKTIEKEHERSYKFFDQALAKLASHRYIIAPFGMITEDELPESWGLLDEDPKVIVKCQANRVDTRSVIKVINAISRKNAKIMLENQGVVFGKQIEFPHLELL